MTGTGGNRHCRCAFVQHLHENLSYGNIPRCGMFFCFLDCNESVPTDRNQFRAIYKHQKEMKMLKRISIILGIASITSACLAADTTQSRNTPAQPCPCLNAEKQEQKQYVQKRELQPRFKHSGIRKPKKCKCPCHAIK